MTQKEELKWYALYTKSRFEKKTAQLLAEIGFEVYVPLVTTMKQWSDRLKKVEEPLFRSYIFIKTTPDKFHVIRTIEGAVYIITFNKEPAIIPEQQILNIKLLLNSDEKFEISQEEFKLGDQVEVFRGSLKGLKGSFVDYRGKKNILVRVDVINQNIVIHIPPLFVRKI